MIALACQNDEAEEPYPQVRKEKKRTLSNLVVDVCPMYPDLQ